MAKLPAKTMALTSRRAEAEPLWNIVYTSSFAKRTRPMTTPSRFSSSILAFRSLPLPSARLQSLRPVHQTRDFRIPLVQSYLREIYETGGFFPRGRSDNIEPQGCLTRTQRQTVFCRLQGLFHMTPLVPFPAAFANRPHTPVLLCLACVPMPSPRLGSFFQVTLQPSISVLPVVGSPQSPRWVRFFNPYAALVTRSSPTALNLRIGFVFSNCILACNHASTPARQSSRPRLGSFFQIGRHIIREFPPKHVSPLLSDFRVSPSSANSVRRIPIRRQYREIRARRSCEPS